MQKGSIWQKKAGLWVAAFLICGMLLLCYRYGHRVEQAGTLAETEVPYSMEDIEKEFSRLMMTRTDYETEAENPRVIELSQEEDEVIITEGGAYLLKGEIAGRLQIDAEEQVVHLLLDGVRISAKQGPALWVKSAGKVILTLRPETENIFIDSADYHNYLEEEACIYSTADLTINGSGKMMVYGFYKDAIRTQDVLRILDGDIQVKCKRTGIHGNDGIHVTGGQISIASEKNGFRTTKSGPNGRGNVIVSGGEHQIIAGRYSFLVGRGELYIYNCVIREKSVIDTYKAGGRTSIQDGCIQ